MQRKPNENTKEEHAKVFKLYVMVDAFVRRLSAGMLCGGFFNRKGGFSGSLLQIYLNTLCVRTREHLLVLLECVLRCA